MFDEISTPARVAALPRAIEFLEVQRFPWNDHYLSPREPCQSVEVTFAGPASEHFMMRASYGILMGKAESSPRPLQGGVLILDPSN
jgi:hypothetical protein